MKLHSLRIREIGVFKGEHAIDFDALGDARVVAVHGQNGAGKSTALECILGALYRETPSRGPVAGLANAKDSLIELDVELDQRYRAQLQIDGVVKTTKQSAYLFDGSGAPLANGKLKDFDAAVASRFPALEVLLSSAFAAQGHQGRFLDLPAADRKALFARLLGLARLEQLSATAGVRARASEVEQARAAERVQVLAEQAEREPDLRWARDEATRQHLEASKILGDAERDAEASRAALATWQERRLQLRAALQDAQAKEAAAVAERQRLTDQVREHTERARQLDEQVTQLDGRLRDRERVEALAAQLPSLSQQFEEAEAQQAERRRAQDAYQAARAEWIEQGHAARADLDRQEEAQRQAVADAQRAVITARDALERAESAAQRLGQVPCHGSGKYSDCPLLRVAVQGRDQLWDLRAAVENAMENERIAKQEPLDHELARERLAEVKAAQPAAPTVEVEIDLTDLRRRVVDAQRAAIESQGLADVADRVEQLRTEAHGERDKADQLSDRIGTLGGGAAHTAAVLEAQNDLTSHDSGKPAAIDEDLLRTLRARESEALRALTSANERLSAAVQAGVELAKARAEADALAADLGDWQALQKALGRNGVQALEIDAAGPEVSDLTNDLLHACYGTRFSVSLETMALKADGSGTKEVFELRVIDGERGTEGPAEQLSGGEQVLVSEALSLAIAIYNTRRSSIPLLTLVRDEVAGALDHDAAVRYVEMLRRAVQVGGFHRVFYVAHQPHLWDQADASIIFADGTVRVEA